MKISKKLYGSLSFLLLLDQEELDKEIKSIRNGLMSKVSDLHKLEGLFVCLFVFCLFVCFFVCLQCCLPDSREFLGMISVNDRFREQHKAAGIESKDDKITEKTKYIAVNLLC